MQAVVSKEATHREKVAIEIIASTLRLRLTSQDVSKVPGAWDRPPHQQFHPSPSDRSGGRPVHIQFVNDAAEGKWMPFRIPRPAVRHRCIADRCRLRRLLQRLVRGNYLPPSELARTSLRTVRCLVIARILQPRQFPFR